MEKVDILLATYNGEKYLREQLDSLLNQTYKNFRLLISDDCSTDSTREILKEYVQKDSRMIVYNQSKNQGIIKNFEFLLNKVESKYFMFCDQDDIWKDDKIDKSVSALESTNSDLVYSDLEVVDEKLNVIYKSYWKLKGIYRKVHHYNNFEALYLNNFITGCTILSKKELIKECMPIPADTKYVLYDYWMSLIISQKHKITYIDEPLIQYRQHKNNSIGSKKRTDEIQSFDEVRKLFIEVKKQHFSVFIKNEDKFVDEKYRKLNHKALKYFEMLETKNTVNFSGWLLFIRLYWYEGFIYSLENFMILNFPGITRWLFKFRKNK